MPRRNEREAAQRVHRLRACDLHRLRGHLKGADDPPYAAHVWHERHPRHHPGRSDPDRGHRARPAGDRTRPGRRDPRHHQRRWWVRRDRPHAGDVQGPSNGQTSRENAAREDRRMTVAVALAYLVAAVLFILGLIQLSSPKSARRGNQIAAVGMAIALLATIPLLHFTEAGIVITLIGLLIGIPIGAFG